MFKNLDTDFIDECYDPQKVAAMKASGLFDLAYMKTVAGGEEAINKLTGKIAAQTLDDIMPSMVSMLLTAYVRTNAPTLGLVVNIKIEFIFGAYFGLLKEKVGLPLDASIVNDNGLGKTLTAIVGDNGEKAVPFCNGIFKTFQEHDCENSVFVLVNILTKSGIDTSLVTLWIPMDDDKEPISIREFGELKGAPAPVVLADGSYYTNHLTAKGMAEIYGKPNKDK